MTAETGPRLDVTVLAPVLLVWLLFWWPQLAGQDLLFVRDLALFASPAKQYWLERMLGGELPQWTTLVSGGLPYLADPANQSFYPLNLLMLSSSDVMVALGRYVLAHLLLGMLGVAGMVRTTGGSRIAAVFAAGLFGLSGYVVSITDNITYVAGVAWVPVALAGWLHARCHGGSGGLALAALALAATVLAGDVLAAVVAGATMCLLLLAGEERAKRPLLPGLAALALVGVVALLLSAVQVLPASAMFEGSSRDAGLDFAQQTEWSFPVQRTLEFVQPYFFGSTYPMLDFLAPELYPTMRAPWVHSVYVGLLPVALSVAGALAAPRRAGAWLALAVVSLLFSYGANAPWYGWLAEVVPAVSTQRYPEKLVAWSTLAVALLAARGLDALRSVEGPFARLAAASAFARTTLSLAVLAVSFVLLLDWPARALIWERAQNASGLWSDLLGGEYTHLQGLLLHTVPVAAALLLLLWVPARAYAGFAVLLALAAVADLALVHRASVPVAPAALATAKTSIGLDMLRAAGGNGARIYYDDEAPGKDVHFADGRLAAEVLAALGGDREIYRRGYLAVYAMRFSQHRLSTQVGTRHGVRYLNGRYSPLQPASHLRLEQQLHAGGADRLLASTGSRFVITAIEPHNHTFDVEGIFEVGRDEELNLRLLEVRGPQRFARLATGVRVVSEADDYQTLVELQRRDAGAALVEMPDPGAAVPGAAGAGRVEAWRRGSPERIQVTLADTDTSGLLVLTESWAPGWRATVDGEPAEVLRADLRLLGVAVPAGGRRVLLEYHTPRLLAGATGSLAGIVLCLSLVARRRPR